MIQLLNGIKAMPYFKNYAAASGAVHNIASHENAVEILMTDKQNIELNSRFFGLHFSDDGVVVNQGDAIDEIGDITTLDEELAQSDRFISSGV